MTDIKQIIAKNIKYLREIRGYTQEQLAEAANLSVSHLSKVESGKRRIGMKAYLNILQIMEVTEEEFTTLATNEKKENGFIKFQDIFKDCNEVEKKFLLDTLKSIKENITETVIQDVRKEITNAAVNIRNNNLPRKCNKENCSKCYLNHLCLSKTEKKQYAI